MVSWPFGPGDRLPVPARCERRSEGMRMRVTGPGATGVPVEEIMDEVERGRFFNVVDLVNVGQIYLTEHWPWTHTQY